MPAFVIKKKNGNLRMVIDYRELNKASVAMKYPIPKMHNFLLDLKGAKIFSQIDLNMGYYQIPIEKEDIPKLHLFRQTKRTNLLECHSA